MNCELVNIFQQPSDERLARIYDENCARILSKDKKEIVFNHLKYKLSLLILHPLSNFVLGEEGMSKLFDISASCKTRNLCRVLDINQ
jgi:hypothetical protein